MVSPSNLRQTRCYLSNLCVSESVIYLQSSLLTPATVELGVSNCHCLACYECFSAGLMTSCQNWPPVLRDLATAATLVFFALNYGVCNSNRVYLGTKYLLIDFQKTGDLLKVWVCQQNNWQWQQALLCLEIILGEFSFLWWVLTFEWMNKCIIFKMTCLLVYQIFNTIFKIGTMLSFWLAGKFYFTQAFTKSNIQLMKYFRAEENLKAIYSL